MARSPKRHGLTFQPWQTIERFSITGVTGNQGGAVARSLLGTGFSHAAAWNRREIDIAGDMRTMPDAAETLTEALDRPITFAQTPIEQVRQYSKDMAVMLEWFERVGYSVDIAGLEQEFGRTLTKLPEWARRHGRPDDR